MKIICLVVRIIINIILNSCLDRSMATQTVQNFLTLSIVMSPNDKLSPLNIFFLLICTKLTIPKMLI